MNNSNISKSIKALNIDNEVIKKLNQNNIITLEELWSLKRIDLRKLGLTDYEIKHIIIKLQLHSMDLNKKVYNKN